MIYQLFLKVFILLAVINVALLGVRQGYDRLVYLSCINLIAIVVLLFQHREDINSATPDGRRTLFSPSVFFLIAIWFGIIICSFVDRALWDLLMITPWLGSIGAGLFFYIGSYVLFGMAKQKHGWVMISKLLFGILFLGVIARVAQLLMVVYHSGTVVRLVEQGRREVNTREVRVPAVIEETIMQPESDDSTLEGEQDLIGPEVEQPESEQEQPLPEEDGGEEEENAGEQEVETTPGSPMRYSDLIPRMVNRYGLSTTSSFSFDNVPQSSPLYESFNVARAQGMIGGNIDPQRLVGCQNLMVIVGLAEQWDVDQSQGVFERYRSVATQRGLTEYCPQRETIATTDFFGNELFE